ncbi:MAG: STAS domain-containing protein [Planctomycetota bacterium]|nr:STAS domain-containing protein [Planctomycetota bacterium]
MTIQAWSDHIWLVKLGDEPSLSDDLLSIREKLQHAAKTPHIVLDLSGVTKLNSSNLSQLLRLRALMFNRQAKLRLAAINDTTWAVFLTTGLEKIFEFTADVPTALAGLQMQR